MWYSLTAHVSEGTSRKLLQIDTFEGNTDVTTRRSTDMGPIWPFRKKKPDKPRISRSNYMKNVVEYEKKTGEKKEDKESHLKEKKFLDAMALLSKKTDDD